MPVDGVTKNKEFIVKVSDTATFVDALAEWMILQSRIQKNLIFPRIIPIFAVIYNYFGIQKKMRYIRILNRPSYAEFKIILRNKYGKENETFIQYFIKLKINMLNDILQQMIVKD